MQSPFRARNWILFVLINVLVSAATAFLVTRALTQAVSRPATPQAVSAVGPAPAVTAAQVTGEEATATPEASTVMGAEQPSLAPPTPAAAQAAPGVDRAGAVNVRISSVIYPGQRSREVVVIVNEGDEVDLTGWTLSNPRGQVYTFGKVALFKDSFINLYTTNGVDVPTKLFWNQPQAMWQVGDEVVLRRGDEVIATYVVK